MYRCFRLFEWIVNEMLFVISDKSLCKERIDEDWRRKRRCVIRVRFVMVRGDLVLCIRYVKSGMWYEFGYKSVCLWSIEDIVKDDIGWIIVGVGKSIGEEMC